MASRKKTKTTEQVMLGGALPEEAVRAPVTPLFVECEEPVRAPARIESPIVVRVSFHELETTKLQQIDYDLADEVRSQIDVAGAFVKVTAQLRPSERASFDGQALKDDFRARGARAVLLATTPVAEAPTKAAREEVGKPSVDPYDAIKVWFDALPVPEDERADAMRKALEILESEGG